MKITSIAQQAQGRPTRPPFRAPLAALLLALAAACSRIDQPEEPRPEPLPVQLQAFRYEGRAGLLLSIPADTLAPRKGRAYTLSFRQPIHGKLALQGGRLHYTPPATDAWTADSARYTVCQEGSCGSGWLVVRNVARTAACTVQPTELRILAPLASFDFQVTAAGTGRLIEWAVENYTLDTLNGHTLQYFAAGRPENWGYDIITYRWEDLVGCYTGTIEVHVGDTCGVRARPARVDSLPGSGFIDEANLMVRTRGCRGQWAQGLVLAGPTPGSRQQTPRGLLNDTTIGGRPGLYYRRLDPGTTPDTARWYYREDFTERITRAQLILRP